MTTPTPYLSDDDFRERTIMDPADVERLQGVSFGRDVADVAASDVTPETPMGITRYAGDVVAVQFTPDAALVADPANYATVTVYKRDNAGALTAIASVNTSALGWTVGVPVRLAITSAPVANDDVLTYAITKSGTGVVVPTGRFFVKLSVNFITRRIAIRQALIDGRMRKRYVIPLGGNDLEVVLGWLVSLVTKDGFDKRGRNPTSEQDQSAVDKPFDDALAALKEAADSKDGLLDLALAAGAGSGVSAGGPMGYSETSPYVAFDIQREAGRSEDCSGAGTGDQS